jgi:hypothetical protein
MQRISTHPRDDAAQSLTATEQASLRDWFLPDRPGPQVGLHLLHTGHGACFVDRWRATRVC